MSNEPHTLNWSGVLFSLACAACVGIHVVLSKLVLSQTAPLVALACMTFSSLVYSLIPFLSGRQPWRFPTTMPRKALYYGFLHSLLATGGMAFTWSGLKSLNPTVTSFVGRTEVIVSVLCAVWFLGERLSLKKVVGFILGLVGVVVLSFPGWGDLKHLVGNEIQHGILLVLAGASCFGSCEVFSVKCVKHMSLAHFIFLRSSCNFTFLLLLVIATAAPIQVSVEDFAVLAIAAFLGPYLGRFFFMASVQRIPLSISVGLNQTQPLFAALAGSLFLMDLPTSQQWIGGALILSGCLFLVGSRGRHKRIYMNSSLKKR